MARDTITFILEKRIVNLEKEVAWLKKESQVYLEEVRILREILKDTHLNKLQTPNKPHTAILSVDQYSLWPFC